MSATEFQFDRGLSKEFHKALNDLVESPDVPWLRDLLRHPDIIPAVRRNSLNFYYCGCSIFRLTLKGAHIAADTHVKYLLRQKQAYVELGPHNQFNFDPSAYMWSEYKGPTTLKEIMKAASVYAGPEKTGLHALIKGSLNDNVGVIDVEVSFTREGTDDSPPPSEGANPRQHFDRLDVVTLEQVGGVTRLVFHEAKHFANKELRATAGKTPLVVEQIERYRQTIQKHKDGIAKTYKQVRHDLAAVAALGQRASAKDGDAKLQTPICHPLITSPASFQIHPEPRLVIFGFDQDQKKGEIWNQHYRRLHDEFGLTVYAVGDPKTARAAFAPGHPK